MRVPFFSCIGFSFHGLLNKSLLLIESLVGLYLNMVMIRSLFAALSLMIAGSFCVANESRSDLGMWAWKQAHFDRPESRVIMFDFCEREGITHIDQHVSIRNGAIANADAFRQFIIEAAERGITVNALRGDKKMFFAENHMRTMSAIEAIVAFNQALPEGAKLLGIKFDVEPYLTAEWKEGGESRKTVMFDYLSFLDEARVYLNTEAPELELAVDVPFWWDKADHELRYEGSTKRFVYHIQDRVDWVGIMSYRRDPGTTALLVADEIKYAADQSMFRSVAPAMETSKLSGKEAHISFGGVPATEFRAALDSLRIRYAGNLQVRCIMLHHYGSLSSYLNDDAL